VPIIFKGSGWHVTDYGRGSYPKKREGEKSEASTKSEEGEE
jgi:predicted nucleic acid-binding Zn ribbon protein